MVLALLTTTVAIAPLPAGANGPTCPTDDEREDDDAPATATDVGAELFQDASFDGALCDDEDWFRQTAVPGAELRATLAFSHAEGDLELDLYRLEGGELVPLQSSIGQGDIETVTTTMLDGDHYVRVRSWGQDQAGYTLSIAVTVCPPDDAFEPNDTLAEAPLVTSGTTTRQNVCDADHLAIELTRGDRLTISGRLTAAPLLDLLDPSGDRATYASSDDTPSDPFDYSADLVALETGRHTLLAVPFFGPGGLLTTTFEVTPGCDAGFSDVPPSAGLCPEIAAAALLGLTTGNPDGTFRPSGSVLRGEMAAFLTRLLVIMDKVPMPSGPATPTFPDVGTTHVFYDEIEWLVTKGVTTGRADGTYDPAGTLNRQELAAFVFRLDDSGFSPPATPTFRDVPVSSPFYAAVEFLADRGIVTGYGDGRFGPTDPLNRQAMAAILVRAYTALSAE